MRRREELQQEIEKARAELNRALDMGEDINDFYEKSVYLDHLIEKYIDLCERNESYV
jgi:hypothetical protein